MHGARVVHRTRKHMRMSSQPACLSVYNHVLPGVTDVPQCVISIQTSPPTQPTAKCSYSCTILRHLPVCGLPLVFPDMPQRLQLPLFTVVVPHFQQLFPLLLWRTPKHVCVDSNSCNIIIFSVQSRGRCAAGLLPGDSQLLLSVGKDSLALA